MEFRCVFFDGKSLHENANITIDDGIISSVDFVSNSEKPKFLITPCFTDAHTHISNSQQVNELAKYGINRTFDVCGYTSIIDQSQDVEICSSMDMAMGLVNPKKFVEKAVDNGAKYIKVLLFNSMSIGLKSLKNIVEEAHKKNLKVVAHATMLATYKQAVESGVDIILHLPMKDELTSEFACEIANKGIYVAPTLIMMHTFAKHELNGYKHKHFDNALKQVETLYNCGVNILVGTDANIGNFSPAVSYGDSVYQEIDFLLKANVKLEDCLIGATTKVSEAFGLNNDGIKVGYKANILVFKIDDEIKVDYSHLYKIWMNGKEIR